MLQDLKIIMTKKGKQMAFAKLADYKGFIEVTFFPPVWEKYSSQIEAEKVYAFKGKVDGKREVPSFLVESIEDIATLQQKAISSIHIQLEQGFSSVKEIAPLRDILFGGTGTLLVYFHIEIDGKTYVVKANTQLTVPNTKEYIDSLKDISGVNEVWTE